MYLETLENSTKQNEEFNVPWITKMVCQKNCIYKGICKGMQDMGHTSGDKQ